MSNNIQPIKTIEDLPTGISSRQLNDFIENCGADYTYHRTEEYPVDRGAGMRARIICIHKKALEFFHKNIELGSVFAFSKVEADEIFSQRLAELNS